MILFLDYDGVFHPDQVAIYRGNVVLQADGVGLFEYAPLLLEALEPHPLVEIVLSTSWVPALGFDHALQRLPAELQSRVIGSVWEAAIASDPDLDKREWSQMSRYDQIQRYLERHPAQHWIALDDDVLGWPDAMKRHLVETNGWGLTRPNLDELSIKLEAFLQGS